LDRVRKKLCEAKFFLEKMIEEEDRDVGDRHFDFYLSAFLSAGRSVDYWLRCDFPTDYPPWREEWNARNPADDKVIKFMADDRREEVHGTGSGRDLGEQGRKLGIGDHRLSDGSLLSISGPPGMEPVELKRPAYSYTIDDEVRPVADVGREYFALLNRLVSDFEAEMGRQIGA
jgi:hypothetical protein